MVGSVLATGFTALARVPRAAVRVVGRSRLSPCRVGRKVGAAVEARIRKRDVAEVDWFEGIEPDELAG
jgi:hypothetical protein